MILDELTQITGYKHCYASQIFGKRKILGYVKIVKERFKYAQDNHKTQRKKEPIL